MKLLSLIGATVASIVALAIGTTLLKFIFGLFGLVFGLLKVGLFFGMIALIVFVVYKLFFKDHSQAEVL